jgi:signal transduction histidine kinase
MDFKERTGIRAHFDAPVSLPALSDDAELAIFRALQEALSNVVRHAEARDVQVSVTVHDGHLALSVEDDGRGFPVRGGRLRDTDHRMGLTGMRERLLAVGGHVQLANATRGALVRITVPIPQLS